MRVWHAICSLPRMRREPSSSLLRYLWLIVLGVLLSMAAGCAPSGGQARPIVYATATVYLASAIADAVAGDDPYCKDCRGTSEIPVYPSGPVRYDAPPLPPSTRDRVPEPREAVAFDAHGARATLAAVDLSSCRELGAPRGYGHAIVTYSAEGFPAKVVVDDPAGLSDQAVKCVGERLGTGHVPAFGGPAAKVGVTWFIP